MAAGAAREQAWALLLLTGHGLAGAAAGAGIGAGALTAHGQPEAMAATAQAADVLETLEGHALLAAQVTLQGEALGGAAQLLHISVVEIFHPDVRVHAAFGDYLLGTGQTDPIHVGESDLDSLIARDIDAGNPSHRD